MKKLGNNRFDIHDDKVTDVVWTLSWTFYKGEGNGCWIELNYEDMVDEDCIERYTKWWNERISRGVRFKSPNEISIHKKRITYKQAIEEFCGWCKTNRMNIKKEILVYISW